MLGVGTKETGKKCVRINSCPLCRDQIEGIQAKSWEMGQNHQVHKYRGLIVASRENSKCVSVSGLGAHGKDGASPGNGAGLSGG